MVARVDTLIVGGGSAGCVLAARLSDDPARQVMLLEAGPDYPDVTLAPDVVRLAHGGLQAVDQLAALDWGYEAAGSVAGHRIAIPRGRVMGGSGSINGTIFLRGIPEDFATWASMVGPEWAWDEIAPAYRAIEADPSGADGDHGRQGPVPVFRWPEAGWAPTQAAFHEACLELGYGATDDHNAPDAMGVGALPLNQQDGVRMSPMIAFLTPEVRARRNLTITSQAVARRLITQQGRVTGVVAETPNGSTSYEASEVILAAGAVASPQLLLLAGIGPAADLRALGIPVVADVPGVGLGVRDHPKAWTQWRLRDGLGLDMSLPGLQLSARYTATDSDLRGDMMLYPNSVVPGSDPGTFDFRLEIVNNLQSSAGRLWLRSTDPTDRPAIDLALLSEPTDRSRLAEGVRRTIAIGQVSPLRELLLQRILPGEDDMASDAALDAYLDRTVMTGQHISSSCRMGRAADPLGVVDIHGRVRGISGLRVIDASIMPDSVRANIHSTVLAMTWLMASRIDFGDGRMTALLALEGVSKEFPGVRALEDVRLSIEAGEIHALLGENGAGKSTLIKIISGVYTPDEGTLHFEGEPVSFRSPHEAQALGIATIFQELSLYPELTVAENIFMGHAPRRRLGPISILDWKTIYARATDLLASLNIHDMDVRRKVGSLNVGNRQRVEIAKALSLKARVLIMDEPTAALTETDVERLFQIVRLLKQRQVGIIYISHRLQEVFQLADTVTVLRDGHYVGTTPVSQTSEGELIRMMVGRTIKDLFPKLPTEIGSDVLEVRNLTRKPQTLDVSLNVRAGEIVGLAGLVGSGRSEFAQVVFGILPADSGTILLEGKPVQIKSPAQAMEMGIAYVPEDRGTQGLVRQMKIRENVSMAVLQKLVRVGFVDGPAERKLALQTIKQLSIRATSGEQVAGNLSGGNQQKVVVGKWLASKPKLLIVDEPTRGVDVGAKAEIHRLISELAQQGLGILMISSELPEVLGMSDRVLVMREGRLVAEFSRAEANQENVGAAMMRVPGVDEPDPDRDAAAGTAA